MSSLKAVDAITRAVLYEGYLLYPYTPHSTKNRQRWTLGGLYPPRFVERFPGADSSELQSECLIVPDPGGLLEIRLRFLHLIARQTPRADGGWEEWEEASEREISLPAQELAALERESFERDFRFDAKTWIEGAITRRQEELTVRMTARAARLGENLLRLTIRVRNTLTDDPKTRGEAVLKSLASAHLLLSASNARFISLIDPPDEYREAAEACRNQGTWPVMVGEPGETGLLLSAPMILYDYPQIAPESPGDLFDGGEIDEILSLRILTLTEEEKEEIRRTDERGRAMLERTEKLSKEDLLRLHGTWRNREGRPDHAMACPPGLRPGSRVRIRPKLSRTCTDVFDLVLAGMSATVQAVEQDFEGRVYLQLSIDEDPGRDLESKAQLGHRFFFSPEDVESL